MTISDVHERGAPVDVHAEAIDAGSRNTLTVDVIRDLDSLERLIPEWRRLFFESRTPSLFADPIWLTTWARHYVEPEQLYVLEVRRNRELVGLAPFYKRRIRRLGIWTGIAQIRPLGFAAGHRITEIPWIVSHPSNRRRVVRSVVQHFVNHAAEWDWAEIVLSQEQGWVEWQWVEGSGVAFLQTATIPAVVLPLPDTWDALRSNLKRNVKESIRRGVNRLARDGYRWEVNDWPENEAAVRSALQDLVSLHRARAAMQGTTPHDDKLVDDLNLPFLEDVAERLGATGSFVPVVLRIDGSPAAAKLVLRANGEAFFSLAGLNPAWSRYSAGTVLKAEVLRSAIARGDTVANFSVTPDRGKLEWSELLECHHVFHLVAPRRRSRLAFQIWWQRRAADALDAKRTEALVTAAVAKVGVGQRAPLATALSVSALERTP